MTNVTKFTDITPASLKCSMSMACPSVSRSDDGKTLRIRGAFYSPNETLVLLQEGDEADIEIPAEILEGALGVRQGASAGADQALASEAPSGLQPSAVDPLREAEDDEPWAKTELAITQVRCAELEVSRNEMLQKQRELVGWIIKLCRRLDRAKLDPGHVQKVMDYLFRKGLTPSVLRERDTAPKGEDAPAAEFSGSPVAESHSPADSDWRQFAEARIALASANRRIAALEEGLKPFARAYRACDLMTHERFPRYSFSKEELRHAASLLQTEGEGNG